MGSRVIESASLRGGNFHRVAHDSRLSEAIYVVKQRSLYVGDVVMDVIS